MGPKGTMVKAFAKDHNVVETLGFAYKLLGIDEEAWRTTEEGRHFKLETETGEIKAGFGGKLTGRKLGEKFTPNPKGRGSTMKRPNTSKSAPVKSPLTETQRANVEALKQRVKTLGNEGIGRTFGRYKEELRKADSFLKEYDTFSESKKQEYAGVKKSYLDSLAETQAKADACREELEKRGLWDDENQDVKKFPTSTPEQDATLNRIGKRIANLKNEQSFIVGSNGEILAQAKGDKHSVGMTVGTKREFLQGAISLHNHPEGGTFSYDDLDDFGFGATELRVSTPEGTYTLKNDRYGRGDINGGWVGMRDALEKAVPSEVSIGDLMKQADANLRGNETRQKLDEIAQTCVKMKDAGASNEILQAYFDESGYDELTKKAQKERKDEIRRLEVAPFHEFYQQHAAEYGFEYTFEPAGAKREKKEAQTGTPEMREPGSSYNPGPSKGSAKGENHFSTGFTSKDLGNHLKHMADVGATSAADYVKKATELGSKPVGGDIAGNIDSRGRIVRYNKQTCELFVGDPRNGRFVTYFRVKKGNKALAKAYMANHFPEVDIR